MGERPRWSETLRALRAVRGTTQEGWAAQLGVSRKTVQRWEAGERAPDPGAAAALVAYCAEQNLFRAFSRGPLAGQELTADALHDLLAEARWQLSGQPEAAAPPRTRPPASAAAPPAPAPRAAPPLPRPRPGAPEVALSPPAPPAALSSFIGRRRELATLRRLQPGTRLLTLTGVGGGGKTRLALALAGELARAYPHGVWFVDLASLTDPALLPQDVAAALGIVVTGQQAPTAALADTLRSRHALLLLDNCEHLLPACAELVEALLRACPGLAVVATSREALGIGGETVWRVPPLALPPASGPAPPAAASRTRAQAPSGTQAEIGTGSQTGTPSGTPAGPFPGATDAERLFVERARLRRPDLALAAGDAAAVADICRRLDGLPLAIELAAARISVLSVAQIAGRLRDRFRLLAGGPAGARSAPTRHQTLWAAMDWSYDLLDAAERATLRALSVFAGGFTLEAAEAVCDATAAGDGAAPPAPDVLHLLARLVDKSLVQADVGGGAARYRLLETVRQYAAGRLESGGEAARARDAHARYYLHLAERASPEVLGPDQARWHAHLETEHDNLRAALACYVQAGDAAAALRLAAALRWFWYRRRHWDEGYALPARVLALPGAQARTAVRAEVLEGAGLFAMWRDPPGAQAMWEESIAINLEGDHPARAAQTYVFLAWLLLRLWRLDEAAARAAAALELAADAGDTSRRAIALALLGAVAARCGEHATARERYESALALRRRGGDGAGLSLLLLDMAKAAFLAGDVALARARAEEALQMAREAGIRQAVEEELRLIARMALAQGDLPAAAARADELRAHVQGRGAGAEADALAFCGQVAQAGGDLVRAAARYGETLRLAQRLPDPGETAPLLFRDAGDQPGVAVALEGTAALIAYARPAQALHLAGAAGALRARARQPLTAGEGAALERALAPAHRRLGSAAAGTAREAGQDGAIEGAIALALDALDARGALDGRPAPEGAAAAAVPRAV
jgi:non-specific serine/threonine protein kinase